MFMRVTSGRYDRSRETETIRFTEQQLAPALRHLQGCRGYYAGINRETGRHCSVSLWDSSEQAQILREALGQLMEGIRNVGIDLEATETYEIIAEIESHEIAR